MTQQELALEIANEGGWEEFYQKRENYTMYDYHKGRRISLQMQYNRRFHPCWNQKSERSST